MEISGFFFVGLVVASVFLKEMREWYWGLLLPAVFAFVVSLTPDINVNHKYIMISYAFAAVLWGGYSEAYFSSSERKE